MIMAATALAEWNPNARLVIARTLRLSLILSIAG
jgi:hypothetical protein